MTQPASQNFYLLSHRFKTNKENCIQVLGIPILCRFLRQNFHFSKKCIFQNKKGLQLTWRSALRLCYWKEHWWDRLSVSRNYLGSFGWFSEKKNSMMFPKQTKFSLTPYIISNKAAIALKLLLILYFAYVYYTELICHQRQRVYFPRIPLSM